MSHGMPFKALSDKWFGLTFFSHVLATSGYFSDYMSKTFNCKEVYIGGQPRNDKFFDDSLNHFPGYRKIIVWMPTMRRSSKWGHDDAPSSTDLPILDERSLLEVNDLLVRNDSLLIVKFHPLQDISTHRGDLSNIKFYTQSRIDNEKIDVYSLLSISSALITDYSSVLFDYLLLNRPIGFTIDDARQYVETRGLAFPELFEHLPGSRISTHTQLFDFISDILLGKDTYSLERSKMNDLCNLYQDGGYSERLIEFLGIGETP
jgi:CDP-glycerol glycerophosphotransferase (TagB/SpsB family)